MPALDWIAGLTVAKLKDELKKRKQPVGGKKAELIERLEGYIKEHEVRAGGRRRWAGGGVGCSAYSLRHTCLIPQATPEEMAAAEHAATGAEPAAEAPEEEGEEKAAEEVAAGEEDKAAEEPAAAAAAQAAPEAGPAADQEAAAPPGEAQDEPMEVEAAEQVVVVVPAVPDKAPQRQQQQQGRGQRQQQRQQQQQGRGPRPQRPGGGALTMSDITTDELTKTAEANWSAAALASGKPPAFDPKVVQRIYTSELGGAAAGPPSLRRVQLLEISQYLENYLWPNFDPASASVAHVMSIIGESVGVGGVGTRARPICIRTQPRAPTLLPAVMVNEKFREGVPAWTCFMDNKEALPAFFQRVLSLKAGGDEAEAGAMRMHERVAYLVFMINAFQARRAWACPPPSAGGGGGGGAPPPPPPPPPPPSNATAPPPPRPRSRSRTRRCAPRCCASSACLCGTRLAAGGCSWSCTTNPSWPSTGSTWPRRRPRQRRRRAMSPCSSAQRLPSCLVRTGAAAAASNSPRR